MLERGVEVNKAYQGFLRTFNTLLDKNCPVIEINRKTTMQEDHGGLKDYKIPAKKESPISSIHKKGNHGN